MYFVFLSNFGICYKYIVSYRYLLLRIAIHIGTPVSAVYRCIVSALSWANVDLDLCRHMASLGHNELICDLDEFLSSTRKDSNGPSQYNHDDVIKWKYFPRYWPFVREIHRSPVNFPHKGQWRGALMFTLICAQKNGWVNNGEAGDLRRYLAHYDVIVMMM